MNDDGITFFSSFIPRNIFGFHDFIDCLDTAGDNVNLTSNGSSSRRLITSNHDNFNTSRSTLENSIRDTGLRRVDKRNKTTERKTSKFEVEISRAGNIENSRVEGEFFTKKMEFSETKNSFTFLTETEINLVEFSVPFLVDFWFTVTNKNI